MKNRILKKEDFYLYDYFIYPNLIKSLIQRKQGKVFSLKDNNSIILSWGLSLFIGGEFSRANGEQVLSFIKDLSSPLYVYVPDDNWHSFINLNLSEKLKNKRINSYFFDTKKDIDYSKEEHIIEITPDFLKNSHNTDCILSELYSYTNLEDFFQNGVGVALVFKKEVVGFCLSEYSTKESLGANIWIDKKYCGLGYAKKLTNAFLYYCKQKNKNVYWVCDNDNIKSNKVAKSSGFEFENSDIYFEI